MGCLLVQPAPEGGARSGPWRQVAVTDDQICGLNTAWKVACTTPGGSLRLWYHLETDYELLEGGYAGICGLTKQGQIECFGTGDLANPPQREGFESLSVGYDSACAQHEDGTIQCWGNDFGLIDDMDLPTQALSKVSVGSMMGVVLTETGEVSAWGLVPGTWDEHLSRVQGEIIDVEAGLLGVVVTTADSAREIGFSTTTWDFGGALQGAGYSYCARDEEKSVQCLTTEGPALSAPDIPFRDFDTADGYACGVTESRSIRCWGDVVRFPFD
jgi:hypothetical protein